MDAPQSRSARLSARRPAARFDDTPIDVGDERFRQFEQQMVGCAAGQFEGKCQLSLRAAVAAKRPGELQLARLIDQYPDAAVGVATQRRRAGVSPSHVARATAKPSGSSGSKMLRAACPVIVKVASPCKTSSPARRA